MHPQNNYTLKHIILTKSASKFSARGLSSPTELFDWPQEILNKRLMVNFEDLETHFAEVERCEQHPQTKSVHPVLFFGRSLRKGNPWIQTQRSPTREHHKQHRHHPLRCLLPSPPVHQFRHDLQKQAVAVLAISVPSAQGTDSASVSDELISSSRTTLISDITWNGRTWLTIGYLCMLYFLTTCSFNFWWICPPAMRSAWQFKEVLRNGTQKIPISNFNSLPCLHTSSLQILPAITWLHQIDPSSPSLQKISRPTESYGKQYLFTPSFQKFTCRFQRLLTANINPEWSDYSIHAIVPLVIVWHL